MIKKSYIYYPSYIHPSPDPFSILEILIVGAGMATLSFNLFNLL